MHIALIPAAGQGLRMGGALPKQYQLCAGRPLIAYAIEAFASVDTIDAIYVVLASEDRAFPAVPLSARAQALTRALPVGGPSRHESVLHGLDALQGGLQPDDWVLVHDAARPGLSGGMIAELLRVLAHDPIGGLLALPVADTLKSERSEQGQVRVAHTVERAGLWQAQTPQMFRYGLLRDALTRARERGQSVTDEASAMELAGWSPRLVNGSQSNFKVTYPEDLQLAELLFGRH
jgi:2-C-methyl-D-erythritol 4-phosphate cytidylyltransferase